MNSLNDIKQIISLTRLLNSNILSIVNPRLVNSSNVWDPILKMRLVNNLMLLIKKLIHLMNELIHLIHKLINLMRKLFHLVRKLAFSKKTFF